MKYLLIITLFTCLLSCKKTDTTPTPAGDANVQSQLFNINNSDWSYVNNVYSYTLYTSLITDNVLNTGAVQLYITQDGVNYIALPFTEYPAAGSLSFNYEAKTGQIAIYADANYTQTASPGAVTFKVVVIDDIL